MSVNGQLATNRHSTHRPPGRQVPNIIGWRSGYVSMDHSDRLRQLYNEILAKGPFPTEECGQARITSAAHGALILYLADIAGLASRGEQGLAALPESDKAKFRKLASRDVSVRVAEAGTRITPEATPKLHALIEATEQARLLVLRALEPQLA